MIRGLPGARRASQEPLEADPLATAEALEELGRGRLPPEISDAIATFLQRARQRLDHSREHVVVAFAGGTGSGKSSLVNAVVGTEVSPPGVRRPTTDHARAAVFGAGESVEALLDWLQVYDRQHFEEPAELAGAVLLDLPDIDSVVRDHWAAADRLVDRCDLLVWVVDPLKYAHAVGHQGYLSRLAHHAEVVLIALNHADRLDSRSMATCRGHLEELLAAEGLDRAAVWTVAARTGEGVGTLRRAVVEAVEERRAPLVRLQADAAELRGRAVACLPEPQKLRLDTRALADGLSAASNGAALAEAAEQAYQRGAERAMRSPLLGAVGRGFARLRGRKRPESAGGPAVTVRRAQLSQALYQAVAPAVAALPEPAAERLRQLAAAAADPLGRDLRDRLEAVPVEPRGRIWWRMAAGLRGAAEWAAFAGLVWLVARGVADWLALPTVPAPVLVGELRWPTALFAGGLTVTGLFGILLRGPVRLGARRHRRKMARQLAEVSSELQRPALDAVQAELERCRELARRAHGSD